MIIRNMTEMVQVVSNVATYFSHLYELVHNSSNSTLHPLLLEDYPNCGLRNNDTFSWPSIYGTAQYGIQA